jgi:hypothetical protein
MRPSSVIIALSAAVLACAGTAAAQTEIPLTVLEMAVACAPPTSVDGPPAHALHVIGAQDVVARSLYGTRDLLIIDGGTGAGVQLGQRFYVRRTNHFGVSRDEQYQTAVTAGWINVVAVNESTAIANIEHVCGPILQDDYLEAYTAPSLPPGADRDDPSGEADFSSLGRIVVGNEQRSIIGAGDFALIDRGADQGITAGARFSVYRDIGVAGMPLASIGEAIVVSTGQNTALARITRARDAIFSGDYVALRK